MYVDHRFHDLAFLHELSLSELLDLSQDIGMDEEQARRFLLAQALISPQA